MIYLPFRNVTAALRTFILAIFYLIVSPFQSQECGDFRVLPICTITVTALYGECDAFP